jgi:hypothetical protein
MHNAAFPITLWSLQPFHSVHVSKYKTRMLSASHVACSNLGYGVRRRAGLP